MFIKSSRNPQSQKVKTTHTGVATPSLKTTTLYSFFHPVTIFKRQIYKLNLKKKQKKILKLKLKICLSPLILT